VSARTVALACCLLALAGCGGRSRTSGQASAVGARHSGVLAGTIVLRDKTWNCHGPVQLALVRVELPDSGKDAVHFDAGCTGTIRRLEIPGDGADSGPGGDGVKVHAGAHDIVVLGGTIDCGAKVHHKHQDAIQAMGGTRVVFHEIVSRGCANSFMFVNTGRGGREVPHGIQCISCTASTNNYSIFVGSSVGSGAVGGTFRSRVPPHTTQSAVTPVISANSWTRRVGGRFVASG
jgi:hypothetical protein